MTKQLYVIKYCRFDLEAKTTTLTVTHVWSTSPDEALGVFGDSIKKGIVKVVSMRTNNEFGSYEEWKKQQED